MLAWLCIYPSKINAHLAPEFSAPSVVRLLRHICDWVQMQHYLLVFTGCCFPTWMFVGLLIWDNWVLIQNYHQISVLLTESCRVKRSRWASALRDAASHGHKPPCDLRAEIEFPEQLGQCGKSVDSGRRWSLPLTNLQTNIVMRLRVVLSMWPLLSWRTMWSPCEDCIKLFNSWKKETGHKESAFQDGPSCCIKCFHDKSNKNVLSRSSAV